MTTFKTIEDVDFEEVTEKKPSENQNEEKNNYKETLRDEKIDKNIKSKVSFLDEDYSTILSGQKKVEEKNTTGTTEEKKEEKNEKGNSDAGKSGESKDFDASDYQDMSEFLIEIIDVGISTGLKTLAKDKTPGRYEVSFAKKQKLSKMLAKILSKHQFAVSIEFLFCITLVMCYWEPAKLAMKNRKEKEEKDKTSTTTQTTSNTDNVSNNDNQAGDKDQQPRAGRPKKNNPS